MVHEEAKRYPLGKARSNFYEERLKEAKKEKADREGLTHVLKSEKLPWENSRHGKLKHLMSGKMRTVMRGIEAYIQELPPGGSSGKHRHMAEEIIFVLEGKGHDMHWDVDADISDRYSWRVLEEGKRFDWQEGDIVYIPPNTVHKHFNDDRNKPARFISAMSSAYSALGYDDIEQIENAPK